MSSGELTQYREDPSSLPGATRIGTIWLMVPPINIHYNNPKFENVMNTLRSQSANHIKTGRGLYTFDMDIVFSGVAMINDKLAPIIAQIRRSPFTVIYNKTVCDITSYSKDSTGLITYEAPIAITGYTIHTEMDLPDTLVMRLSFMVYNYSPMVRAMQYLKQTLDQAGNPVFTTPAQGIADSNLFEQYYSSLLSDQVPDFMFTGELETMGTVTDAIWQTKGGIKNPDYMNEFVTRMDPSTNAMVKNGQIVKRLDTTYNSTAESFTIGLHVGLYPDPIQALDLSLGAYKSRRLKKWISSDIDLHTDIINTLTEKNVPFNTAYKNEQLIAYYGALLGDVAVSNVAGKYIKQYTITSDTHKNIEGIAVRRMIPITVLPIISSAIPTCQYMGGADTEVTVTIFTNDEAFINELTNIDQTIESSQRRIFRHAGSELTYIQNDIVNLNSTFIVTNGNMDIQSIPENPGSYIITWSFTEQGEVLKALTNIPGQIRGFKKDFIKSIVQTGSIHQSWTFDKTYNTNDLIFASPTPSHPSFIYTVVIPSMIRSIRNGFIRHIRETPDIYRSAVQSPAAIGAYLYSPSLGGSAPPVITVQPPPVSSNVPQNGPVSQTPPSVTPTPSTTGTSANSGSWLYTSDAPVKYSDLTPEQAKTASKQLNIMTEFVPGYEFASMLTGVIPGESYHVWDAIWQIITTGSTNLTPNISDQVIDLYPLVAEWLAKLSQLDRKNPSNTTNYRLAQIQDGFAEAILSSVNDRLELVLNSPNLLQYEVDLMKSSPGAVNDIALASFVKNLGSLGCYPDLGLPFDYIIEDNNKKPVLTPGSATAHLTHTFYDPDFYIMSGPSISDGDKQKNILDPAIQQIKADLALSSSNGNAVTGIGSYIATNQSGLNQSTNGIADMTASIKLGDTDPTNTTYANIARTNLQNTIKDNLTNLQSTPLDTLLNYSKASSFQTIDELSMSDNLLGPMGQYGSETNDGIIAEATLEHKIIKSTMTDMNPSIEQSLAYIIKSAHNEMVNDPKYYSMNKAYPTFKLYFKIEENPQWFLFDQLFDFRAVEDIRYYKDKISPASTLNITLNNYNNILTDLKALMAKQNFKSTTANTSDQITNQYTDQPLHSLFVRPGTQIQLKVGYAGRDTDLTLVFNGFISEVNQGERFEILCQSYGIELLTDAGINSVIGWYCSAKQLMWWMLLGSDTKHLGGNWIQSLIPHGIKDFLGGYFPKDQNIYLSEEDEPGKLRHLQSYNADNMTKWDVFQDLAAANPGYVCQTVPFFNTETIFFGHPDHTYTYTQDMGTRAKGYPVLSATEMDSLTSSTPNLTLIDEATKTDYNWLEWVGPNSLMKESYDKWYNSTWATHLNSPVGQNITLYCKYVELLAQLDTDPNNGNIQYNLFNLLTTPIVPSDNITPNTTTTSTSNSTTSGVSGNASPVTINSKSSKQALPPADLKQARRSPKIIAETASISNGNIWSSLPPDQRLKWAASLTGSFIDLKEFKLSGSNTLALAAIYTSMGGASSLINDPAILSDVETLSNISLAYLATNNESDAIMEAQAVGSSELRIEKLIYGINLMFQKYGIGSIFAIICWAQIGDLLDKLGLLDPNSTVGETNLIQFGINVNPKLSKTQTLANGLINFAEPLNITNLKTHIAFRQILVSKSINVNPIWQELQCTLGQSPIKKRFRQYHIKTGYKDIINNNIRASIDNMWNRVKIKYKRRDLFGFCLPFHIPFVNAGDQPTDEYIIQAGQTLDERITRELVVPVENARTVWQARNYATSILAEGIRNMYTGTLTLVGDETIKPYDIIYIYDDYNKMYGPIEVKSINHIISAESGFISIVEPQCCVDTMGVSLSWSAALFKIFETTLVATIALPFIIEAGVGIGASALGVLGIGTLEGISTAKIATTFGKIISKAGAYLPKTLASAKALYGAATEASDLAYTESLSANIGTTLGAERTANAVDILNELTLGSYTEATIGQAPIDMLKIALNKSGVQTNTINYLLIKASVTGVKTGFLSSIGITGGTTPGSIGTLRAALGLTTLNIIKAFAVLSVPLAYQIFAGIDDSNYACPLKITCLRLNDEPYFAGIDSVTHQSGIWNYIKGQFLKVIGSTRTITDWLAESVQALYDSN